MPTPFDAIVIGTGQAGPALAVRLAGAGLRTAIIERKRFGGTCVNVGCIPTKTLVASARAMHMARRGAEFGFSIGGDVRADMRRIKARKDAIVRQSSEGVEGWVKHTANLTVIEGHARFTGSHSVCVNGDTLEAPRIFVNVGARAAMPKAPGATSVPYLTNTTVLDLDTVPEHLVVVGGSYIGLEFAQIFRRFGSRVTVVERGPRLIAREDEDVSSGLLEVLQGEGIEFRLLAPCIDVGNAPGGVRVSVDCTAGAPAIDGSHVLFAVGRRPNTDDLGVEAAGLTTDAHGFLVVDDECRTSVAGVWALGECNGRGAFTHTAYNDYEIVADNLLAGASRRLTDRIPCYALYTDPPVGRVGMSLAEAHASGRRLLAGRRPMAKVGRAKEMSETAGFMRAIVDADTQRILGAVVFGIGGDEVVQSLLDVMYADAPYTVVARAMHIHPTVTELIPTMLQQLRPVDSPRPPTT